MLIMIVSQARYVREMLHLTCGYAGTGKDSLYNLLRGGACIQSGVSLCPPGGWLVYADADTPLPHYGNGAALQRAAFADALKGDSFPFLGLPGTYIDYEAVKNTLEVTPAGTEVKKILRQYYIEYGAMRRKEDIHFWPKRVLGPHIRADSKEHTDVTDFRFLSEEVYTAEATKAVGMTYDTMRVYRSDVKVADKSVQSEHELDDFQTTYLFVTSAEEFVRAVTVFPQYATYMLRGAVGMPPAPV